MTSAVPAYTSGFVSKYGYIPTTWICVLYVLLFGLSTILHLGQSIYFRKWWLIPTIVLAGAGELLGWAARLWFSQSDLGNAQNPFLIQICATIISPTPLLAADFIILGIIINHLGQQYSRLTPNLYTIVFCTADIFALIVQAVGGATASSAFQQGRDTSRGGNIMLCGIIIQLIAITIYSILGGEFFYRYLTNRPIRQIPMVVRGNLDHRVQLMVLGLAFSTVCLFIRAIYRTVELADGWAGPIFRTEVYLNVLDGAMIIISIYTFNFFHPGVLLKRVEGRGGSKSVKSNPETSPDDIGLSPTSYALSLKEGLNTDYAALWRAVDSRV